MDWSDEYRYDVLMANPDVKRRIQEAGAGAHAPMSGEDFMVLFAVRASHNSREARALIRGSERGHQLGLRLNFRVVRTQRGDRPWPVGEAIVAVLCSMAHNSQKIQSVQQRDDGCEIATENPSDYRSTTGVLQVAISRKPTGGSVISATAKSLGQLIDYGKARKTLMRLFSDINRFAASGAASPGPRDSYRERPCLRPVCHHWLGNGMFTICGLSA
jgi:hypothetical protein